MLKNYYQILGLEPNSSKEEIKKAYRMYATKFHPDKQNNDEFFEERFKEIKEAYDILIDDNKRALYDSKLNSNSRTGYSRNFNFEYKNSATDYKYKEKQEAENAKRAKVYYTSKELTVNGLYLNCNGKSFKLADFDSSTIRKDDNSNFIFIGIVMIIVGILTIAFFIGALLLAFGVYGLFYKEYFVVLVSSNGDTSLIKGRKYKMKKISNRINKAIKERFE